MIATSPEQQMRDAQMKAQFPKMKPVRSSPIFFTLNGCGFKLYGTRDFHDPSSSYVTTWFFTILFLPIFPIKAYRVIRESENSYYFLGKEPLSRLCGGIQKLLLIVILFVSCYGGWNGYVGSEAYQNRVVIRKAHELLATQKWSEAVNSVLPLMDHRQKGDEARSIVQQANDGAFASSPETMILYITFLAEQPNREQLLPNFANRMMELAQKYQQENPAVAINLMKYADLYPGETEPQKRKELFMAISNHWWKKEPQNALAACEYVIHHEEVLDEQQQRDILLPFIKNEILLDSEAARILGGILFREGRYQEAVVLLTRYNNPRMEKFHQSVKNYQLTLERRQKFFIDQLDQGLESAKFYSDYDKADETQKARMVNDYLVEKFKYDPAVQRALELQEQTGEMVAPVMQLGIAQLNLSHEITQADDRTAMLRSAEGTFLSIRGAVGETDEYRLFLGEISYWLGKHDEGKKLFDELLSENQRSTEWIMEVAIRLRDVGEVDASRKLLEEAWEKEKEEKSKQGIASIIQIMAIDMKERTKWLNRCDQSIAHIKTAVHENAAQIAFSEGRHSDAIAELKAALKEYKHVPDSSSKLNNEALAWQSLALQTGNIDDFRASVVSMERSVRLQQSSVAMANLAAAYQSLANWQMNQKIYDLVKIPDLATSAIYFSLCKNAADYRKIREELHLLPEVGQSIKLFGQVQVMAPKNADSYGALVSYSAIRENEQELEKLLNQIKLAQIDFTESFQRAKDYLQKDLPDSDRANLEKSIQRYRKLFDSLSDRESSSTGILVESLLIRLENNMRAYADTKANHVLEPLLIRAQNLHARSRCYASIEMLHDLYCESALVQLREDPVIDTIYQRCYRQLEASDICTMILLQPDLVAKVSGNEHLKKAYQLNQESMQITNNEASLQQWVWSRGFAPERSDALQQLVAQSKLKHLIIQLEYELAPYSANDILYRYVLALALEDASAAQQVLEQAKARGISFLE